MHAAAGRPDHSARPARARAALDAVAGLCFALAVFEMPLGLLASIHATLPVVSTILSAALLGERMRPVAWVASILALCGTLLILKPGFGPSPLGVWLAVCSTLAYASRDIVTRRLPAGTDTLKIVLASLSLIGAASALLPDDIPWRVPTPGDAGRLAGAAASFITANLLIVAAFRRSPISTIAPLRYTSILWALAFDAVLWGIVPDATGWAGTCLIVASGLVILRRHS